MYNKKGESLILTDSYINGKGELKGFKKFTLEDYKKHIDKYRNCHVIDKSDLEDYEIKNIERIHGKFKDVFLIIIDYPGIGFVNYFLLETENDYLLTHLSDSILMKNPNEFIDASAYLAEYKV
jgi:hypothetical protein